MGRHLPPFAAVKAFEAAARHKSFKLAAEELCLSPSAVSHQIRALEEYLDTALFERNGNRMDLTLTGRAYAGKLTGLLDLLDDTTRAVRGAGEKPLRVLCTPGFAARWLVPRLGGLSFGDRIRLRVSTGAPDTDFSSNDSDVVIQWRDTHHSGVHTEPLMTSSRYPVIRADLKDRENIRTPRDLLRMRLMYDETDDSWAEWFAAAGLDAPDLPPGPTFPNCELATTAAEQGHGVAMAFDAMVQGTLASGRLVRLFDTDTLPSVIYSVACTEDRKNDPMVQTFRSWLHDEVRQARTATAPMSAAE
ncbi:MULTISPECIES: LysR substrate-binding domain-containing protein [unclassified Roseovarius]|uniref:LysR substrate-binding domain-containing protein n=1 Tax=unclassified Roseovarius TaxID=2614913 RepID=UPI00273F6202|nr:LysR substrate-binding domain-containing protein [Roseovarius sp. MMSF_3350]